MLKVAVRELVEFVLRSGDIQLSSGGPSRTLEGIKAHQWIQKAYGSEYQAEVRLSFLYEQEEIALEVHGRADGIIQKENGFCIDEIKSTTMDVQNLDENTKTLHWAQAQCYAFIYASQAGLDMIETQLTYYQLDHGETRIYTRKHSFEELKSFFFKLIESYLNWAQKVASWRELRDFSIRELSFPYVSYRPGQRDLVVGVYKTIQQGKKLFAQAPTGIGKTMGTLFPSIKALSEGLVNQIFYLTAKTMTRTVAEKALGDLQCLGLRIKRLTLTAKDKICFLPESSCDPEECPYAKGYYDRVRLGIEAIFEEDSWSRVAIESYAQKYSLCPFEFSLDLSLWADTVICDYNYVFDPRVYLRRIFLEGGDYVFLVDEAHNLVDRGREMFSAELVKEDFLKLKKEVQSENPKLAKKLQKVNSQLVQLRKNRQDRSEDFQKNAPTELYNSLQQFVKETEQFLKEEKSVTWKEQLLEAYFTVVGFLRTAEMYDERYITLYQQSKERFLVRLYCLDPSKLLQDAFKRGRAAVLFSATLSPLEYFMQILGGEASSYKMTLNSPFPAENLCLMLHTGISTRYTEREASYVPLARIIATVVQSKIGNYLIFFPSYDYLQKTYTQFAALNTGVRFLVQTQGMREEERENFLSQFVDEPEETLVGFALMGGIFGEGIDLTGSRLSGAVIVGVGLPQICFEREMIRTHFQKATHRGFEYAYMFPGFNKVLQAVGRVIRTEEDQGLVMLIDERFAKTSYKKLFPKEWQPLHYVSEVKKIAESCENFWGRNKSP